MGINKLSKSQFLDRDLYLMAVNLRDSKFVGQFEQRCPRFVVPVRVRVAGHDKT
jgi:hypothetical protein